MFSIFNFIASKRRLKSRKVGLVSTLMDDFHSHKLTSRKRSFVISQVNDWSVSVNAKLSLVDLKTFVSLLAGSHSLPP